MGSDTRRSIVVVGGGGAGTGIVSELLAKVDLQKYRVILVNARPFYTFLIAGARFVVTAEGKLEDQALIPFDRALGDKGELVVGTVASIKRAPAQTGGEVVLDDGREVPFDFLVLAPGSVWPGPLAIPNAKPEADAWISDWREKILAAKSIVVAGGGAVGIEIAGELRHFHPTKRVTMVQKNAHLLNAAYPEYWRLRVEQKVRDRGVELVLDDTLELPDDASPGTARTYKGKVLDADLVIPCVGTRPNTDFVRSLGGDVLSDRGFIKVAPSLQLPQFPEIFAAGDATDWDEQKQIAKAYGHVAVVAANILAMTKGQPPAATYKGSREMVVITFGPNGGSGYLSILWGIALGDWLSSLLKSKGLMLAAARQKLGY